MLSEIFTCKLENEALVKTQLTENNNLLNKNHFFDSLTALPQFKNLNCAPGLRATFIYKSSSKSPPSCLDFHRSLFTNTEPMAASRLRLVCGWQVSEYKIFKGRIPGGS